MSTFLLVQGSFARIFTTTTKKGFYGTRDKGFSNSNINNVANDVITINRPGYGGKLESCL